MQLEATDWSIRPTLVVHPQGFTPTSVQFLATANKLGEEVLKREIFYSLEEAKVLTEQWRREYNTIRPHSSLRYRPPAPEALRPDPFFLNLPKLNGPHPRLQEAVGLTQ